MTQAFRFAALTPAGLCDSSIAIAASRAGALGVLNLEHTLNASVLRRALAQLARYTDQPCGIRLDRSSVALLLDSATDLPGCLKVAILTPCSTRYWAQAMPLLRQRGLELLAEVTNVAQARLATELSADGLVAKGHEAGGWVGEETTFVLLQRLLTHFDLPVWAHGGIGSHTAAACYAGGAAGVVLDSQLALARESRLPDLVKAAIAAMDGSETICLGAALGQSYRVYTRGGALAVQALGETALALGEPGPTADEAWQEAVEARAGWGSLEENVWPLGQDAALAASLAQRGMTVGGIIALLRDGTEVHVQTAAKLRSLAEHAPLAHAHGTRYAIAQGPMTRVSDRPEFALQVAEAGALPFLALALMRAPEVETLLAETKRLLGNRPWGVGILGFVPYELRQEQLAVIRRYAPPFALIAGGRPDQALALEAVGIPTYLHVPSPGLLRLFLQDGARRFVFEGRECGGHVGPRSSFVLWETMTDLLLQELPSGQQADCCVLFAGGIHDDLSATMLATLAAPLAERGVKVGLLMGTAYLFTEEAVSSGAILPAFQNEALRCQGTVLLESSPGHATRCAPTPFVRLFAQEKLRLRGEGKTPEEIRNALEELNIGRLRIASKGIARNPRHAQDPSVPSHNTLNEQTQFRAGLYMIGQVAALRDRTCTMAELHRQVIEGSVERLARIAARQPATVSVPPRPQPSAVAIIGISGILPGAKDFRQFWGNVMNRVNAITEIPKERWDADLYYDPDRKATDKIYSRWGGFIPDVPFDPLEFGIPPSSLRSIDPMQLLGLLAARDALADAGYAQRPFDRSRTSVILGASGGTGDLGANYLLRAGLPLLFGEAGFEIAAQAGEALPTWTEDSFAGLLLNVAAGRIANRLDLAGLNYVVDAACASSLAAIHLAVQELETRNTDLVIAGGADTVQNPFGYLCFSKTRALSSTGQARVFDASADGIVISEGVVMLVLKRLADAERDGDRIYAVIQGVGGSSDGRAMGMTAPRPEGQILALERAYAKAGFSPTTVGLFEAHGTGTVVGDRTEAQSLATFLKREGALPQRQAVGSVKSMIGHTKAAAGVASLAKVTAALYHKVLPPTCGVTRPNPNAGLGDGPLYVNSEPRPWIHGTAEHPRRAGVSAFGFGGTNFHAVVEEYTGDFQPEQREAVLQEWPTELFLWHARSREQLADAIRTLVQAIGRGARPVPRDLAYTLWQEMRNRSQDGDVRLAIVASSLDDLRQKLAVAGDALGGSGQLVLRDARGIYLTEDPLGKTGKVAFLFPGQGSQYPNMLRDLAIHFSEVREALEETDRALAGRLPRPLSSYIFPPPAFSPEEERGQQLALTQTQLAQPALGATAIGAFRLLGALGVRPELVAGHSYGEYAALCVTGVMSPQTLAVLSEARGRAIVEATGGALGSGDLGTMAAVRADARTIASILESVEGVWIANLNTPSQTIISGTVSGIAEALKHLEARGIGARPIPVACAFHSPLMAPAQARLTEALSRADFVAPTVDVFSNTTAEPYGREPEAIRALLAEHLLRPVRFGDEIEAMYAAGARLFVEVGPKDVLTGLVSQILGDRLHLAVALDLPRRDGLIQLQHALAQLASQGAAVNLDRLWQGRSVRRLDLGALEQEAREKLPSPTMWLVNGSRARPASASAVAVRRPPLAVSRIVREGSDVVPTGEDPSKAEPFILKAASDQTPMQPVLSEGTGQTTGSAAVPSSEAAQVMNQFQQLMGRFLETQKSVMLVYLQGRANADGLEPRSQADQANLPKQNFAGGLPSQPADESAGSALPALLGVETESVIQPRAALPSSREELTRRLLEIVSDRTGYPSVMLELDIDIEARLGIDSIKRVEILGALQRACLPPDCRIAPEAMDRLTSIKTLGGIAAWVDDLLRGDGKAGPASKLSATEGTERSGPIIPADADNDHDVPRSMMIAVEAPPILDSVPDIRRDRVFVITDDGHGIAQAVSDGIRSRGGRTVVVAPEEGTNDQDDQDRLKANLSDPAAISTLLAAIRQRFGPVGGIIHLLPLRDHGDRTLLNLASWRDRLRREVKGLFHLAKAAGEELRTAGETGTAWLVAATALGGRMQPLTSGWAEAFPGQGGAAGLLKTLALEWPAVRCKAVHLDPYVPDAVLAEQILSEIAAEDGLAEVGYADGRRWHWQPVPVPLEEGEPQLAIRSDWVILVTGGARGITAEVACLLAELYRPTLVLVGSSLPPAADESPQTRGLNSPRELKATLMAQMRASGEPVSLSGVEFAYNRLLKEREARGNLTRMRQAGATVEYRQVDVRDEQALGRLVDEIHRNFGRLDGVIHGAGIIEDKLIEDKTAESFDRVFDTKADSAFILSRVLPANTLRFLVFFASAAGVFGNRGQCDYAATNEVLNRLAVYLDGKWPGRVVSLNWGPWRKTGMVSPELQREFAARGVQLISIPAGCRAFDRELRYGRKGESVVVLAGGTWGSEEASAARPASVLTDAGDTLTGESAQSALHPNPLTIRETEHALSSPQGEGGTDGVRPGLALPLLQGISPARGSTGAIQVERMLDPARDLYLVDHQLDGRPVFPFAMAMELMAEVVQQSWPDLHVVGLRDMQLLRGIVLEEGPQRAQVVIRPQADPADERVGLDVYAEINDRGRPGAPCYRAVVELADRLPPPHHPGAWPLSQGDLRPFHMSVAEAYRRWLFHGPLLQGLTEIQGISPSQMVATCRPSSPQRWLAGEPDGQWLIDPLVLDSALQMIILWMRTYEDATPLPSRFARYRRFGAFSVSQVECRFQVSSHSGGGTTTVDIDLIGPDGRLLGRLDGMECPSSQALNRLARSA